MKSLKVRERNYMMKLRTVESLKPPRNYDEIASRPDAEQWYFAYQREIDAIEQIRGMTVVDSRRT